MWNIDDCIDVTPAGFAALAAIRNRTTRRPMLLCNCCSAPLRECLDDECGTEYALCDECAEEAQAPAPLPNPRFCPSICALCGIGNIYGPPSCTDAQCPNPLKVNR